MTHDNVNPRKPRLCGVMSASGPQLEMLACAYKPGHKGSHSWATLPTFPLNADYVLNEIGRLLYQRYGRFGEWPEDVRNTMGWLIDNLASGHTARIGNDHAR